MYLWPGPRGRGTPARPRYLAAYDRAVGTDTSGLYPQQRDGTSTKLPGTAATRALDRAARTDVRGAKATSCVDSV